ncbi:hypothetical protein [Candidatus Chromulinivorax destructor]|uniref:Uncharacterized protein n=1 Tax=Candidatus Chromulinivorax destructor TaxID=2066483 RepID=A0A345ZCT8_9BACT|nr:hypothetical protein [Candidatus Chromulinivorax destructor]AXK61105.1 hypothetical protein C0J27_05230 [Candidatus Chromulinivorax destructor]
MRNYIKYLFVSFVLSGSFFASSVTSKTFLPQTVTINLPSLDYVVNARFCNKWKTRNDAKGPYVCDQLGLEKAILVNPKVPGGSAYDIEENSYYYIMLKGKQVVKDARLGIRDFVNKKSWTVHEDGTDIIA